MPTGGGSGGGVGGGAIRAGRAFVELFIEDSALYRSLDTIKSHILGFSKFTAKIGGGLVGLGSAILGPLAFLFGEVVDKLDAVKKASDRLGTSPEVIAGLGHAADLSGIAFEDLESALGKMQKALSRAAHEGGETQVAFASLGLDARKLIALPLQDQLEAIASGMKGIENPADRSRLAMEIFGNAGRQLLPLLKDGGAGIRSLTDEVSKDGLGKAAEEAERVQDAFTRMRKAIGMIPKALVIGFLGHVEAIEEFTRKLVNASKEIKGFIRSNFAVVQIVALFAAGLVAAGFAMLALSSAIAVGGFAIGGLATVMSTIAAVILFVLTPVGALTVALVAMAAGFAYLFATSETGGRFFSSMKQGFEGLAETAATTLGGIIDAFKAGDFELAGKIALVGIGLEFAKLIANMTRAWNQFKAFFVDGWHDALMLLKLAWNDLDEWFSDMFLKLARTLNDAFGKEIGRMLKGIADAIEVGDGLGIFKALVKDLRLIGGAFGTGGFSDELERERRKSKKEHADRSKDIHKEAQDAQDARDAARKADEEDADKDVGKFEEALRILRRRAAFEAAPWLEYEENLFGPTRSLSSQFTGASKGAFSGPLGQQLGIADQIPAKTLAETTKIREGVEGLPGALADKIVIKMN